MPTYVFGYGSLINMKTNKELALQNKKIWPVMVSGLKRMLNVSGPLSKHLVFDVKNAKKHSCNGVLFEVSEQELASLVKREKLYEMK
jgi:cation transport regulator ChaC